MPYEPDLAEVLEGAINARMLDLHTMIPGRVESYDAAKQVADVAPVVRRPIRTDDDDQEHEELPVISNVPVQWARGGGFSLHFPIAKGDHVMLVFSEAAIAQWRESGQLSDPGDLRRHDLSYPIAVPGISFEGAPLADAPAANEGTITVGPGGVMRVSTAGGTADFVALAAKVLAQLNALKSAINGWTPVPNDGGAALKTALSSLFASWPASVAATTLKAE